jgi:hypothetical protein
VKPEQGQAATLRVTSGPKATAIQADIGNGQGVKAGTSFATPACPNLLYKEVHMDNATASPAPADADSSLLEGLFQLAVNGQTQGWEFDQIDSEVYARLLSAYGAEGKKAA